MGRPNGFRRFQRSPRHGVIGLDIGVRWPGISAGGPINLHHGLGGGVDFFVSHVGALTTGRGTPSGAALVRVGRPETE